MVMQEEGGKKWIITILFFKGIDKGIIKVESDGSKITYFYKRQYSTSFKNPGEKVRASYFCELVLDFSIIL